MRDFEISKCENQHEDEFLEWHFVVDDSSTGHYHIAYFTSTSDQNIDIERARFVPMNDKYHTDCYAQIAFESGVLYRNDEEVVIEETVTFVMNHLWSLIGLIVGVVVLFCGLLAVIIILWRKQVEMKEFIRADSYDKEDEDEERGYTVPTVPHHLEDSDDLTLRRVSTVDLDVTTPGGMSYVTQSREQRHDSASVTSQSFLPPSKQRKGPPMRTQYEYDMRLLNGNVDAVLEENDGIGGHSANNEVVATLTSSESDSSEDDQDNGNMLNLKGKLKGQRRNTRRPSILGVTREQLKMLQDKDTKTRRDHEADRLLQAEWEEESEISQGL